MIEWLKDIDQIILLAINGWSSPFWDEVMWLLTGKFIWFPLYIFLLILVYRKTKLKTFVLFFIIGIASIGFADFTANYGIKKTVKRYRPSHHLELQNELRFHTYEDGNEYRGGQFGFISGHATNSFAIALFFGLFLKRHYRYALVLLLLWASLISYTRLYLGVHYPSDIIGGIIYGSIISFLGYGLFKKIKRAYLR
jgi:undecaprenyl-diphosphatase